MSKKLGPEALQPVRGGVAEKRLHDVAPRRPIEPSTFSPNPGDVTAPAALPPLYARWMRDILPGAIPSEPHATCDDCAMQPAASSKKQPADPLYFGAATKCCTLIPNLPNFLTGQILADTDPHPAAQHGRATVEDRIRARHAVTPLGLGRTLAFSLHYRHHEERFGQSVALRCPHYFEPGGGLCGVWKHRESTCGTWFCKHDRGATAVRFWSGLQTFLGALEHELAYAAARELGLDNEDVRRVYASGGLTLSTSRGTFASHLLDGQLRAQKLSLHKLGGRDAAAHAAMWGRWVDREPDFYRRTGELIAALEWNEIRRLLGPRADAPIAELNARYQTLRSTALPDRLTARNDELGLVQIGKKFVRADSYRAHDPVQIPRALLEALPAFDGRTSTPEALKKIETDHHLDLDPALVRKLADFGLLVER